MAKSTSATALSGSGGNSKNPYEIDYNRKEFQQVKEEETAAKQEIGQIYDDAVAKMTEDQNAMNDLLEKSKSDKEKIANEQTEFAIEKIEQQKGQAKQDYLKEASGAYSDYQKQIDPYGVQAEQMAAMGMSHTGYAESSKVRMYNAYQARITAARESYQRAVLNYDNAIKEARLQNSSLLAEIANETLTQQLEIMMQFSIRGQDLLIDKAKQNITLDQIYHDRWKDVLDQINKENTLAEEIRQYNDTRAFQERQFAWQKQQAAGSGGSGRVSKSSSKSSSKGAKSAGKDSSSIRGSKSKGVKVGASVSPGASATHSTEKSAPTVDMKSVLALGYGPISAAKLDSLISQGLVTEYEEGGKLKYKRSGIAKKGGTYLR
jgi:hypothetical protein